MAFVTEDGEPLQARALRAVFARAIDATHLPKGLTPHCLRHTYTSQMLTMGLDLAYISQQLGHANVGITAKVYARGAGGGSPTGRPDRSGGLHGSAAGLHALTGSQEAR